MGDKPDSDDAPDFSFLSGDAEPDFSAADFNFGEQSPELPVGFDLPEVNVPDVAEELPGVIDAAIAAPSPDADSPVEAPKATPVVAVPVPPVPPVPKAAPAKTVAPKSQVAAVVKGAAPVKTVKAVPKVQAAGAVKPATAAKPATAVKPAAAPVTPAPKAKASIVPPPSVNAEISSQAVATNDSAGIPVVKNDVPSLDVPALTDIVSENPVDAGVEGAVAEAETLFAGMSGPDEIASGPDAAGLDFSFLSGDAAPDFSAADFHFGGAAEDGPPDFGVMEPAGPESVDLPPDVAVAPEVAALPEVPPTPAAVSVPQMPKPAETKPAVAKATTTAVVPKPKVAASATPVAPAAKASPPPKTVAATAPKPVAPKPAPPKPAVVQKPAVISPAVPVEVRTTDVDNPAADAVSVADTVASQPEVTMPSTVVAPEVSADSSVSAPMTATDRAFAAAMAPRPEETADSVIDSAFSDDEPTDSDADMGVLADDIDGQSDERSGAQAEGESDLDSEGESDADADDFANLDQTVRAGATVSQRAFSIVLGYAVALTLLLVMLVLTGRLSPTGQHPLESLPDIKPLQQNEYQRMDVGVNLPRNHTLKLGESRRFGDVILTPVKVTREPVTFVSMLTGAPVKDMTTAPVLKLWFDLKNAESSGVAFPAWDVGLMSHRSPAESTDEQTLANSYLMVRRPGADQDVRVLNYLHSANSNFDIVGLQSRKMLKPGESLSTFVASSPDVVHFADGDQYRWRIQIRKGVNVGSGNGVTTLVDVQFTPDEISAAAG